MNIAAGPEGGGVGCSSQRAPDDLAAGWAGPASGRSPAADSPGGGARLLAPALGRGLWAPPRAGEAAAPRPWVASPTLTRKRPSGLRMPDARCDRPVQLQLELRVGSGQVTGTGQAACSVAGASEPGCSTAAPAGTIRDSETRLFFTFLHVNSKFVPVT
jgi:hypothetical protein